MSSLSITAIIFGCTFGGALLGMALRTRLPDEHLDPETRETVKLAAGIVGTMTAVLLGLLVASAKDSFDVQRNGVAQLAANVIMLDRTLAHFGTETQEARQLVRASVTDIIGRTWPDEDPSSEQSDAVSATEGRYEQVFDKVLALVPQSEAQKVLHDQAVGVLKETGELRWAMFTQRESTIPTPLLVAMVFWLAISFASFGLFAPRNPTAVVALIACALAVATALFLVLELDRPFRGMIQISSHPLHAALEQLGR